MNRRLHNKLRSRRTRSLRWELVHAAGCAFTNCAAYTTYREPTCAADLVDIRPVRVPRSLRHIHGRLIRPSLT